MKDGYGEKNAQEGYDLIENNMNLCFEDDSEARLGELLRK